MKKSNHEKNPWHKKTINSSYAFCAFLLIILNFLSAPNLCAQAAIEKLDWELLNSGLNASLRGISVVDDRTIWVSGSNGICAKTGDSGAIWAQIKIPDSDSLDFRDIEAFGRDIVFILSAGEGQKSRIYKTTNDGKTWKLQFQNTFETGFFSGMAFWDSSNGIAFSDPVEGKFVIIRTENGGKKWQRVAPQNLPPAKEGEYAFAASGTCITVCGSETAWFGSGGSAARVFRSINKGTTWQVFETPILSGEAATGIFSLAFRDSLNGIAVGGDYQKPNLAKANVALTTDGGQTWQLAEQATSLEYRSCVAFLPSPNSNILVAVGPSGSDYCVDFGETWQRFSEIGFHTLAISKSGHVWAAGSEGRIARLAWPQIKKHRLH